MECPFCESENLISHGSANGKPRVKCQDCERTTTNPIYKDELDLTGENTRLARSLQKSRDRNRIERKSFRRDARQVNALEELNKELIRILSDNLFTEAITHHDVEETGNVGILQISDTHFNELIDSVDNQYNFDIASKRLHKFITKACKYFDIMEVDSIVVAFTGDLLNSDRRPDEILSAATNRANAIFLAVDILKSALLHLNESFDVKVVNVCGNESRFGEHWNWGELTASDNFDLVIFKMLKLLLDSDGIEFIEGSPVEQVINVKGKNILITHGNSGAFRKPEDAATRIKAKYAGKGIILDYILFGHIHSCYIGATFSRSASLSGGNAYSDKGLHCDGKASQNIFIVNGSGIDGIEIDLQNYKNYKGYKFNQVAKRYLMKESLNNEEFIIKI